MGIEVMCGRLALRIASSAGVIQAIAERHPDV
jgi:hypothetical protein